MSLKVNKISFSALRYLFDLDGTLYLDGTPLKGAVELLEFLNRKKIEFKLVTNNSSESRVVYMNKLGDMGFDVGEEQILTSGLATVEYLKREAISRVFLLGTPALEKEFESLGICLTHEDPEAVVLSFDKTLTYRKLEIAHGLLQKGTPYIATHPDFVCPTQEGSIPDCGSFIALLEASTGRRPVIVGKPSPLMVEMAFSGEDFKQNETIIIGDRLYTDMAMGCQAGILSGLVLSGEASRKDLDQSSLKPDFIFEGVFEILDQLIEEEQDAHLS